MRHGGAFDDFQALVRSRPFDVFLYTSQSDGVPNVLLEAMASGLPCIAPDVGGIPELIAPGTGFLVGGTEDVDGYVGHLRQILERPGIARTAADGALALVRERHSWEAFVSRVRALSGYGVEAGSP